MEPHGQPAAAAQGAARRPAGGAKKGRPCAALELRRLRGGHGGAREASARPQRGALGRERPGKRRCKVDLASIAGSPGFGISAYV